MSIDKKYIENNNDRLGKNTACLSKYKFFNFIIIAPSPPSLMFACSIPVTLLNNSFCDLIYSGTANFNLLNSLETYSF